MNPLEQLKKLIEDNKEGEHSQGIQEFLKSLNTVGLDDVKKLVQSDKDVKGWFDSERDKYFNTALDTWKTNNLQKIVEDEIAKRNPNDSPEQKQINELKKQIEERDKQAKRSELKNLALKTAAEKKIPVTQIIDFLIGDDEATTLSNLDLLASDLDEAIKAGVEERFKANGQGFGKNGTGNGAEGSFGKELAESLKGNPESQEAGFKAYFD